jgi:hypothetical protein
MDRKNDDKQEWIVPLLSQLDLMQGSGGKTSAERCWIRLEACRLPEQVARITSEINQAARYQVLEFQDFLPPQKIVLRAVFVKRGTRHFMDIILRKEDIVLLFYTLKKIPITWERYFPWFKRSKSANIHLDQIIEPREVTAENIRSWFTYLLSCLDKNFKPDGPGQAKEAAADSPAAFVRKASA